MVRHIPARRAIALAVAYAIALQALLALAVTYPPDASLCAGLSHQSDNGVPPASKHDCPACPLACGGGLADLSGAAWAAERPDVATALTPDMRTGPVVSWRIDAGWARAPPV